MIDLRKSLFWTAAILGGLIGLAGVAFVGIYILEAIVKRSGDPDQSLLFWYLPVLFIGLVGMVFGFGSVAMGMFSLRKIWRETNASIKAIDTPDP